VGPASQALGHEHVAGPVTCSAPPAHGDHNPAWMKWRVYGKPVPSERAMRNHEHDAMTPGIGRVKIRRGACSW
jgi:hypothetical protein